MKPFSKSELEILRELKYGKLVKRNLFNHLYQRHKIALQKLQERKIIKKWVISPDCRGLGSRFYIDFTYQILVSNELKKFLNK